MHEKIGKDLADLCDKSHQRWVNSVVESKPVNVTDPLSNPDYEFVSNTLLETMRNVE